MEIKNALEKKCFLFFNRKQEAVYLFLVDVDVVWSKETAWNLTGDICQQRLLLVFPGLGHDFKFSQVP